MSRKDRRHDPETAERVTSIIEAAERAAAALIDKADANAKRYLAEAQAEADRAAAERLQGLVETADALVAQAEAIRRESLRLLESLRHADAGTRAPRQAPQPAAPAQADRVSQGEPIAPPAAVEQSPNGGEAPRGKHLAAVPGPEPAIALGSWTNSKATATQEPSQPRRPRSSRDSGSSHDQPQRSDGAAGARLLATQLAVSGSSRQEIAARLRSGFQIEDPTPILDAILGPED